MSSIRDIAKMEAAARKPYEEKRDAFFAKLQEAITFRTERYMVPVLECQETNKIDRIASDGTILYRSLCKRVDEKEATSTNEPISVPSYAAAGISPGSFLRHESATLNDDVKGQPHRGWVVEAFESKTSKTRTSLFGIAQ